MKKILSLIIVMLVISFHSYGQIYTSIEYLDKFDDTIKKETVKTLITRTDSTFIVETKGRTPQIYRILNPLEVFCCGDKDNIVNLVGNVYGYQECWCVVKESMFEAYKSTHEKVMYKCLAIENNSLLSADEKSRRQETELSSLNKYTLFVIHRVITTQYTHNYQGELFWIRVGDNSLLGYNVDRIIYTRYND